MSELWPYAMCILSFIVQNWDNTDPFMRKRRFIRNSVKSSVTVTHKSLV